MTQAQIDRQMEFLLMLRRNISKDKCHDSALIGYALSLISHAKTLHRLNEVYCERELTPKERRRVEGERALFTTFAAKFGMGKVCFGGDPRGFAVKFFPSDGSTNSFEGEGYGVPTL